MTTLQTSQKDVLRTNLDRVEHLPEPDETVRQSELHPRLSSVVDQLTTVGVLERAGEAPTADDRSDTVRLWSVRRGAHEFIEQCLDNRDGSAPALPCGDYGFTNAGDRLVCQFDDCDGAWTKAELRHFWEHGATPPGAPDEVECDACAGTAVRLPSSGERMDGQTMHYYDCEACPEGGHIQIDAGGATQRVGPVFDAERYNAHGDAPEVLTGD